MFNFPCRLFVGTVFQNFNSMRQKINPLHMQFVNPCEQLQTNGTSIFLNKLNLSTNSQAIFCRECRHIYEDTDILFQDYNPLEVESENSQNNADNYNESLNTSNYGKIA